MGTIIRFRVTSNASIRVVPIKYSNELRVYDKELKAGMGGGDW